MHQPNHHNTPLDARISAIESSLEKLRRDTGRLSTMSARNRQDLDHALADLDNLLYATLAAGHELPPAGPPNESQDGGVPAEAGPANAPRCTDPRHDDDPPETRPPASHLITLQPRSRSQEQPQADALPRCIDCANQTLASSAGQRITVTPIPDAKRAKGLNCSAPIHTNGRQLPATTVIVTAGVRPGVRYCNACATAARAILERHRIPYESARVVRTRRARKPPASGSRK